MQKKRKTSLKEWQAKWDLCKEDNWTKRIIPNISPWYERKHGNVDCHLGNYKTLPFYSNYVFFFKPAIKTKVNKRTSPLR